MTIEDLKGLYSQIKKDLKQVMIVSLCAAAVIVTVIGTFWSVEREEARFKTVSLAVMIDKATGCHYLRVQDQSHITPRLDRDGRHVCEYTEGLQD